MQIIRNLALSVALVLAGTSAAPCQDSQPSAEALQEAKELLSVISGDLVSGFARSAAAEGWPAVQASLLRDHPDLTDNMLIEMRGEFERYQLSFATRLVDEAPAVYARYFSADELRALRSFYTTPAGAKALKVMVPLTSELMSLPALSLYQVRLEQAFNPVLRRHGYVR
jgi:hypothetical protein